MSLWSFSEGPRHFSWCIRPLRFMTFCAPLWSAIGKNILPSYTDNKASWYWLYSSVRFHGEIAVALFTYAYGQNVGTFYVRAGIILWRQGPVFVQTCILHLFAQGKLVLVERLDEFSVCSQLLRPLSLDSLYSVLSVQKQTSHFWFENVGSFRFSLSLNSFLFTISELKISGHCLQTNLTF